MTKNTGQYPLLDITTNKLYFSDEDREQLSDIYRGRYYEFNKSERVKRCGKTFFIYKCGCCGKNKELQFFCELRTCPVCSAKMTGKLYNELVKVIDILKLKNDYGNYSGFRHLILTIPVDDLKQDIKKAIKRVEYIRQFLYKKFAKKGIKTFWGAIAGLEIGQKTGMVHYHLLLYCPYIDVHELRKIWKIGYLKLIRVKDEKYFYSALKNIVMYVINFSKMSKSGNMTMERIAEIEMALKGLRRVKTWGIFYNRLKLKVKTKFLCKKCNIQYVITGIKENGVVYSLFAYACHVSDYFKYITGAPSIRMP